MTHNPGRFHRSRWQRPDHFGGGLLLALRYCSAVAFSGKFIRRKFRRAKKNAKGNIAASEMAAIQIDSVMNIAIPPPMLAVSARKIGKGN
jgi:hypothetical protein